MRAFMILLGALAPAVALGEEPEPKAGGPAEKPWRSDLPPLPEIEPITSAQIDASIRRGADFLISSQNKNGSWGSATMTKGLNITAPIPGAHHAFRAGSTGLALEGLLRSGDRRPESVAAIEKAVGSDLALAYAEPRMGDVLTSVSDNRLAHEQLGWKPQVDLETGIAQTVAYYKDLASA